MSHTIWSLKSALQLLYTAKYETCHTQCKAKYGLCHTEFEFCHAQFFLQSQLYSHFTQKIE